MVILIQSLLQWGLRLRFTNVQETKICSLKELIKVNICDLVIIILLLLFMAGGYYRGLVRTVFGLFKSVAGIILAGQAYPFITRLFRETGGLYLTINNGIKTWLSQNAGNVVSDTLKSQADYINGLPLPQFLKASLLSGNNPVIYNAMNVDGVFDYVAGFLANICINIIGWIIAFVAISVILTLLSHTLDLIAKLPVISTFNKLGGLIAGLLEATIFIWIIHVIIVLFLSSPQYANINNLIAESMLAGIFSDYNLILHMINKFIM